MTSAEHQDLDGRDIGAARSTRNGELRDHPTFERHYRIGELAEMWNLGRETVRQLVKDEQGVIRIRLVGRRPTPSIRCPNRSQSASTLAWLNSR